MIDAIKLLWKNLQGDFKILGTQEIDHNLIRGILPRNVNFNAGDAFYEISTRKEWEKFMQWWMLKHKKWTKEFDCDNFADILHGWVKLMNPKICEGVIWVKVTNKINHAVNFIVIEEGEEIEWAYIEPQTGQIHRLTDKQVLNWHPYYVHM